MELYLGIDLGTSAVKLLLTDATGRILASVSKTYPLSFPRTGWAEQNPEDWWNAVIAGIQELAKREDLSKISAVGCGGQMHGLVALDAEDRPIRPAILWNDGRTAEETDYLNNVIGREKLSEQTANIAFAGFTAPKLLWMRRHEPDLFSRIRRIMLPKDYINFKLTGEYATDFSDASGTLLLDVKNRKWSKEMLDICGISPDVMPSPHESSDVIGTVRAGLPLPGGIKVVAGAGDNAAAAVGTGTVGNGACNISLGTSGTIFISSTDFSMDHNNALHAFAHADGHYHLMGCMLSAASCNKWFCRDILNASDYAAEHGAVSDERLGRNTIFFLPYLMGERSPINDTNARSAFVGMSMDTTRADMTQAVLEGVAFAIRDSFEVARSLGLTIRRSKLCGGGAKSPLWRKIFANALNIGLDMPQTEEGPGYGGCMLAMVGSGAYESVRACCDALVRVTSTVEPDPALAARYDERYAKYRLIYPALKIPFQLMAQGGSNT